MEVLVSVRDRVDRNPRPRVVHVTPSVDVLMTMSFDEQPERKRQSCQTTYTLPPRRPRPRATADCACRRRRRASSGSRRDRVSPAQRRRSSTGTRRPRCSSRCTGTTRRRSAARSAGRRALTAHRTATSPGPTSGPPSVDVLISIALPSAVVVPLRCSSCRSGGSAATTSQAIQVLSQNVPGLAATVTGFDHVRPPSVERLTTTLSPGRRS